VSNNCSTLPGRGIIAAYLKLIEKWDFGLSTKVVLETKGRYVNENKIPTAFIEGVPGDGFFSPASRERIS